MYSIDATVNFMSFIIVYIVPSEIIFQTTYLRNQRRDAMYEWIAWFVE